MTDWSDHILLSFGDSFTFGDALFPQPPVDSQTLTETKYQKYYEYSKQCREHSYTRFVSNILRFKGHINFGLPGGSNNNSLRMLIEFLQQNPDLDRSKIFVLFGLTNIYRDSLSFTNKNGAYIYRPFTASVLATQFHLSANNIKDAEQSLLVSEVVFHEMKMIYDYINLLRTLKEILEGQKIKYLIFDIVNDFDYDSIKDGPSYQYGLFNFFYDSEQEAVKQNNLNYNNKIFEAANDLLLGFGFNHRINLRDLTTNHLPYKMFDETFYEDSNKEIPNIVQYIHMWAIIKFGWRNGNPYFDKYVSKHDNAHWNIDGHRIAAKIIKSWIEEQDYSYLEK